MVATRFCAECGGTDVPLRDNFCPDCYWKFHNLCDPKHPSLQLPYCTTCYAIKLSSGWTNPLQWDELGSTLAYPLMRFLNPLPDVETMVDEVSVPVDEVANPDITIIYRLQDYPADSFPIHEEQHQLQVKLVGGICTYCVRQKTGSHQVSVQIRADHRKLLKEEVDYFTTLAFSQAANLADENRENFVSGIEEVHGGIDISLGSIALADAYLEVVKGHRLCYTDKNYKLRTETKDNQRIYMPTYLIRIPQALAGDFIVIDEVLYQVEAVHQAAIKLIRLRDHESSYHKNWHQLSMADPQPELVSKLVVSETREASYVLMDLVSYEMQEVSQSIFPDRLPLSEEIQLYVWKEQYYLPL